MASVNTYILNSSYEKNSWTVVQPTLMTSTYFFQSPIFKQSHFQVSGSELYYVDLRRDTIQNKQGEKFWKVSAIRNSLVLSVQRGLILAYIALTLEINLVESPWTMLSSSIAFQSHMPISTTKEIFENTDAWFFSHWDSIAMKIEPDFCNYRTS